MQTGSLFLKLMPSSVLAPHFNPWKTSLKKRKEKSATFIFVQVFYFYFGAISKLFLTKTKKIIHSHIRALNEPVADSLGIVLRCTPTTSSPRRSTAEVNMEHIKII